MRRWFCLLSSRIFWVLLLPQVPLQIPQPFVSAFSQNKEKQSDEIV